MQDAEMYHPFQMTDLSLRRGSFSVSQGSPIAVSFFGCVDFLVAFCFQSFRCCFQPPQAELRLRF